MVLDYKSVRFSFDAKRKKKRRAILALALAGAAVCACLYALGERFDRQKLLRFSEQLLKGEAAAVARTIGEGGFRLYHRNDKDELRALADLFGGDLATARRRLSRLPAEKWESHLPVTRFLNHFVDKAEYQKLGIYTDYLAQRKEGESHWFAAIQQAAIFQPEESQRTLARLPERFADGNAKAIRWLQAINRQLLSGRFSCFFDRADIPVAEYDLRTRRLILRLEGLDIADFSNALAPGYITYKLTIDSRIQRLVASLLAPSAKTAAFFLADVSDGAIIVSYSYPASTPSALVRELPAAEHIRLAVITAAGDAGIRFPFVCPGTLSLDGSVVRDSRRHGTIASWRDALASSCGVVFAEAVDRIGATAFAEILRGFQFNAPPLTDRFSIFPQGHYQNPRNSRHLAMLAAGRGNVTVTPIQAAMIAAMIATSGRAADPYLVVNGKNILDLAFYQHPSVRRSTASSSWHFDAVRRALPRLKMSKPEEEALWLSTGKGDLTLGFFPAARPRFAFVLLRPQGGQGGVSFPAEFLRRFLPLFQKMY